MGTPRIQIDALTGMRFYAAMMVVLFHFAAPAITDHNYLINNLIARGSMGVDLFFVLSGYIIHHVYGETFSTRPRLRDYRRFLSFRVARMYPVHLFTLALMLILYAAAKLFHKTPADDDSYHAIAILYNLLMTHAWFGYGSPNVPAWSISAEWFMYLLYPLLAMALFRMKPALEWLLAALCIIAIYFWVETNPLLHIVPEFTFGAILYQLNKKISLTLKPNKHAGWLIVALIAILLQLQISTQAVYVPLFGLLILALTSHADLLGKLLARKISVYLGEISYSLYMIHSFQWSVTKNLCRILIPNDDFQNVILVFGSAILSVFLAAVVYTYIEVPGRCFIRRLTDPKEDMPLTQKML